MTDTQTPELPEFSKYMESLLDWIGDNHIQYVDGEWYHKDDKDGDNPITEKTLVEQFILRNPLPQASIPSAAEKFDKHFINNLFMSNSHVWANDQWLMRYNEFKELFEKYASIPSASHTKAVQASDMQECDDRNGGWVEKIADFFVANKKCHCGVPLSIHTTCCGWENAGIITFPWETTMPAGMSGHEKQIRYALRNEPDEVTKLHLGNTSIFLSVDKIMDMIPPDLYPNITNLEGRLQSIFQYLKTLEIKCKTL